MIVTIEKALKLLNPAKMEKGIVYDTLECILLIEAFKSFGKDIRPLFSGDEVSEEQALERLRDLGTAVREEMIKRFTGKTISVVSRQDLEPILLEALETVYSNLIGDEPSSFQKFIQNIEAKNYEGMKIKRSSEVEDGTCIFNVRFESPEFSALFTRETTKVVKFSKVEKVFGSELFGFEFSDPNVTEETLEEWGIDVEEIAQDFFISDPYFKAATQHFKAATQHFKEAK